MLAGSEGGRRRLNEGRRVAEGVETSLLGQQLLVRHGVDVRGEAERGAEKDRSHLILYLNHRFPYLCFHVCFIISRYVCMCFVPDPSH